MKIFNWKQPLLKMALNLLNGYIQKKIKDKDIQGYLSRRLDDLKAGFLIIVDKNPNNKDQFKELFEARKDYFVDDNILKLADELNDRVKDPFAKQITVAVLIQFANEDGTPITQDLKDAYPDLPWDTIESAPITGFARRSSKIAAGQTKMQKLEAEGLTFEKVFNEETPKAPKTEKTNVKAVTKNVKKSAAKKTAAKTEVSQQSEENKDGE